MHENEKAERTFYGNGVCHITSIIDWNSLVEPASGADPRTLGNRWTGRQIWAEVGSSSSAARFSGGHTVRADPVDLHGSEEKADASETNGGDFMDHSGRFHSGEWMYLYHCTWWNIDITTVIYIMLGGLWILLGNYIPKLGQNYTVGIKVPWTLNSERNWTLTHRMAGRLFVAAGIISICAAFLESVVGDEVTLIVIVGVIIVAGLGSVLYSFWLYKYKGI